MKNTTTPGFNGHCAFAVALGKKNVSCNGKHQLVQDGKTYNFSNSLVKMVWKVLPGMKNKAESNWSK